MSDLTGALVDARRRALARLRALLTLSLVVPVVALAAIATWLHGQAFADAATRLDRAARIAHEHALKLFDTNEMLLQRMLDLVGNRSDADLMQDGETVHRRLREMAAGLPQVQGLFINGADARMLGSSRIYPLKREIDYSDRDWYRAHASGQVSIYITPQLVSRATGELAFDMSRRREVDGRFAGSVHVSLRPQYLTDFYADLAQSEPNLRMAIVRVDGGVIARWPDAAPTGATVPMSDPTMQQIARGDVAGSSAAAVSPFDQEVRMRSFRRVGSFPLYVVASTDRDVVIANWGREVALAAALLLPASIALAWSVRVSMRRTRQELETLARLGEETARRQRAEVALLQSQKLEAMGRLTGGVAHDFNNVLAVVSSNVEVMRRLPPSVPHDGQINAIARAVASGTKLTRQLLAFARKQALRPEQVHLQERLPALLDLLRPLLGSSIDVSARVEADTHPIDVDPSELELALINLAVNAGDAMEGRGTLCISARNAPGGELPQGLEGSFVMIDVDDTGPGIPASIAASVFEPFFTTKPLGKGTGLGLSQVQAFCQSAAGQVQILRAPGGGARMRLLLQASRHPVVRRNTPARSPTTLDLAVLLVEDNADVAQATSQLLESMGARLVRVTSGEAAIEFVRDGGAVDVVLSDIQMPGGMDGIALALALRERADPLPVVLISGFAQRLDEALKQNLDVLPKPCSPEVLGEVLRRAAERRKLVQTSRRGSLEIPPETST